MIKIYFDGACRPNSGGTATYGFIIYQNKKRIAKGSGVVGSGNGMTNIVAEFEAALRSIKRCRKLDLKDKLLIKGDSLVVINQVSGKWKITSDTSKKYVPLVMKALKGFNYKLKWIPRDKNTKADKLCEEEYSSIKNNF